MGAFTSFVLGVMLAADPPASDAPAAGDTVDPAGVSPVELIPKLELRQSFARAHDGGALNATTARMDIGFFGRVLLRYEVPLAIVEREGVQVSGLGDLKLQAIAALASTARHVTVAVLGAVLDTATQKPLGAGKQQIVFGAGTGLKVRPWWLVYGIVQDQVSVGGDDKRPDVNVIFVRIGSLVFDEGRDWYKLDLDTSIDVLKGRTRFFGSLEVGSLVVGRVGLFLRAGMQILGPRQLDHSVEAGVRYLFRLGKGK